MEGVRGCGRVGPVDETALPGGFINRVVRIGDTVRRQPAPERADFVRELLAHFERLGWRGAPRFLGVDEQGREMLEYLKGHVAWAEEQPAAVSSEESVLRVAELVREFHDLTAGTPLAGAHPVVCHNDLSPRNTVYGAGLRPVAFIDWDLAAPGERVHDLAHVCWQYLGLGPAVPDPAAAARRIRLIADAYGLEDRSRLVETILWWQERCGRGIEDGAAAGDPAMARLLAAGAARSVRASHAWTLTHRRALEDAQ